MFPTRGLLVSSWVKLEGEASIEYQVSGDEAEFCFGGRRGNFQLVATEDGLENLIAKSAEALGKIKAGVADE